MTQEQVKPNQISVHGVPLAVVEQGHGRPIVVLHGEVGLELDTPFLSGLSKFGRVIAPFHPGFGHAPDVDGIDINTVDDLAYLYLDLLAHFDLHDAILVGCSLGGWIAAEMATKCTERLSKLILVAPSGIKVGDRETRDIPDIFALHPDEVVDLQYHDPTQAAIDYASLSDEALTAIARNREATALYVWEPYCHNPKLRQRLHRITLPTLLVWGVSDRFLMPDYYGGAYRDAIPGATLSMIEQAGHWPHLEQPDAVCEQVRLFVDRP